MNCEVSSRVGLLIISIASCVSGQPQQPLHYVRTPDNASCPGEPCLTLQQYVLAFRQYFISNSRFLFASGNHTLLTTLEIADVTMVTFQGERHPDGSVGTRLVCESSGGVTFTDGHDITMDTLVLEYCSSVFVDSNLIRIADVGFIASINSSLVLLSSNLSVANSFFINCSSTHGGGLYLSNSHTQFSGENTFLSNDASQGGALYATESSVEFTGNVLFESNTARRFGGAIAALANCSIVFNGISTFTMNTATQSSNNTQLPSGGAIFLSSSSLLLNGSSGFEHNSVTDDVNHSSDSLSAAGAGGAIGAYNGSQLILNSHTGFIRNQAPTGGGLVIVNSGVLVSENTLFLGNIAERGDGGGVLLGANSNMRCEGRTSFLGNVASKRGGGMAVGNATLVNLDGVLFLNNRASSGGAISLLTCGNVAITNSNFTANHAQTTGGGVLVSDSILTLGESGFFDSNVAGTGGGMSVENGSTVHFTGEEHLEDNMAVLSGSGGIQATSSVLLIGGHTTFHNNTGFSGGSIHMHRSRVELSNNSILTNNTAFYQGGALYVSAGSVLSIADNGTFSGNLARAGGAVALENAARMILVSPLLLSVLSNRADVYGGGLYYSDLVSVLDCTNVGSLETTPTCFLELSGPHSGIHMNFFENSAALAGSVLYGGGLDRCYMTGREDQLDLRFSAGDSLNLFQNLSTVTFRENDTTSAVSSDPLQICFCDEEGNSTCSVSVRNISAFPGELMSLPVLTLGQGGGAVPSAVLISSSGSGLELTSREQIQRTRQVCTNLGFRVRSPRASELLTLHPEGACGDIGAAHREIDVTLLPCPDGFDLSSTHTCACEERLLTKGVSCSIDTLELTLAHKLWVNASYDNNGTYRGVLLSKQCPPLHCTPPPLNVTLVNSDAQCLFNRSGTLCGGCIPGYSVVLGSTRCLKCRNYYLALLLPFALAGVLLLILIYTFHLTVSEGTINGLIFYANLIQINKNVLLLSNKSNVLTVFVAWLNLDLGIESCFYDGMDTYARTWLQFAFPLYLWVLMGLILLTCRYSRKVADLLGSNSSAVAATLWLLTYTKVLQAAATGLRVSELKLPSSTVMVVWGGDGNLRYFGDYRHILLGLVSLVVLLVFLVITFLILLCTAINCHKRRIQIGLLDKLIEAYSIPYTPTRFSWTGCLMLCRFYLIVNTIFYATMESNALSTLVLVCLLFLAFPILHGNLYNKRLNNILECSFFANLVIFLGSTLYIQVIDRAPAQEAVADVCLGIAFVQFLGILSYHIYSKQLQGTAVMVTITRVIKRGYEGIKSKREESRDDTTELAIEDEQETQLETSFTSGFVVLKEPLLNNN